jgi:hypothetical protein
MSRSSRDSLAKYPVKDINCRLPAMAAMVMVAKVGVPGQAGKEIVRV